MSQKVILEIKNIAKEIESSSNLNISELKQQVSKLYEKLVVLEFLEDSIVGIEGATDEEQITVQSTNNIVDTLDFSKKEDVEETEVFVEVEAIEVVAEDIKEIKKEVVKEEITSSNTIEETDSIKSLNESIDNKKSSLHEGLNKNVIQIGLNDRIAFVKRLFDGNQQDFHRVLSQVNTYSTIDEVKEFIDTMVKPDYNWDNQEEYADRFMEIIEAKFQ